LIRILVSACLLGEPVRHDGSNKLTNHSQLRAWQQEGRLVPVCPEVAAGLPIPRAAAEIVDGGGHEVLLGLAEVRSGAGVTLTTQFVRGANHALDLATSRDVELAILTDKSPSCGSQKICDGNFSGTTHDGLGVTTALLEKNGIRVFSHDQIDAAALFLAKLDDDIHQ